MAAERLPMRKLREVIRLRLQAGQSGRAIARACGISSSTVSEYLGRIALAGLGWPLLPELDDDAALERLLFPDERHPVSNRPEPEWSFIHRELQRRHVTKQLLWQEYKEATPGGLQYSQFCDRYLRWAKPLSATMRQAHRVGEKAFIDFSGSGLDLVHPVTGECQTVVLFLAVLGASNLTYAEPVLNQDLPTWIGCHVRALEYFGGTTEIWVPDNPRVGVTKASKYEPVLNRTYEDLAGHYGAAVIPARPYKPRDKAKVEVGVLIASRWILAVLRNRIFYSMEEMRVAVAELLEKLNHRQMRRLKKSRRELFEEIERAAMKPLPVRPYEYAEWARPRVDLSYHVEHDDHFYSVHYSLIGEQLDLRATEATVEIFRRGTRIDSYPRSYAKGKYTTRKEHMPRAHLDQVEWTPERLTDWATKTGPQTAALVEAIMASKGHPQQGFKACLGVLRLAKQYPAQRIERAAARALHFRTLNSGSVASMLKNNLDQLPLPGQEEPQQALPLHENIRGGRYYH
ncbi:MAG: integrase [Anaeromyxobacter sp. RBG_16_69_14]|nr:MAG: integrase [Anaeromyxobacter sp. RBG_16_69_14]